MNDKVEADFEAYVKRYCKKHKITPEEAKEHALVKDVRKYYETEEGGLICEP